MVIITSFQFDNDTRVQTTSSLNRETTNETITLQYGDTIFTIRPSSSTPGTYYITLNHNGTDNNIDINVSAGTYYKLYTSSVISEDNGGVTFFNNQSEQVLALNDSITQRGSPLDTTDLVIYPSSKITFELPTL